MDINATVGSPPLTRERQNIYADLPCEMGITPADAGKTGGGAGVGSETGDHPR